MKPKDYIEIYNDPESKKQRSNEAKQRLRRSRSMDDLLNKFIAQVITIFILIVAVAVVALIVFNF